MFQAEFMSVISRDNILQNCQYEEMFKGYKTCRKKKLSVCLAIN